MDCYTGVYEMYWAEHPNGTPEGAQAYVDEYRVAENAKQPGDDR